MQTLDQVVTAMAKRAGNDHVILSIVNNGGSSSHLRALGEIFTEEQINAMEDNCVISRIRDLPQNIRSSDDLRYALNVAAASHIVIRWREIRENGTIIEHDVDQERVF